MLFLILCILSLFLQAKELANPFSYEEYIEQKRQEKMEKERANRIAVSNMNIEFVIKLPFDI